MTANGKVISVHGNTATVQIAKSSACGHDCGECRLCNPKHLQATVKNTVGAKVGDEVVICDNGTSILRTAFVIYILPIIGIFAVYAFATNFIKKTAVCVLLAILWVVLWFVYVKFCNKHKAPQSEIKSIIK